MITVEKKHSGQTPFPDAFVHRIRDQFPGEHHPFLAALEHPPETSIRINPYKQALLSDPSVSPANPELNTSSIPWSINGWLLRDRPAFTLDPLFHAGYYYVQEASSMFLEHVLSQPVLRDHCEVVLDACAAPGGKTTLIAALFPDSLVVANEVIRSRVPALRENVIKWGTGNMAITQSEPSRIARSTDFFDLALVDAPCSGEGLFRKNPVSRGEWSEENARHCALRQRSILMDIWQTIRPGGHLVYTTCTFNPEENERNVAWLLDKTAASCLKIPLESHRHQHLHMIQEVEEGPVTGYGFYPHRTPGEGFFLSVIQKPYPIATKNTGGRTNTPLETGPAGEIKRVHRRSPRPQHISEPDPSIIQKLDPWFTKSPVTASTESGETNPAGRPGTSSFGWFQIRDRVHRIRLQHLGFLHSLSSHLNILYSGTEVAKVIRDEIRPVPAAALDIHLNKRNFPCFDCTRDEALCFLRRESLTVPDDTPKGWLLVIYKGLPLGWIKNIGHRTNNYHPKAWRIRS
ncbi:MAG: hypothetical protein WD097_04910 [Balneolales bacterium]